MKHMLIAATLALAGCATTPSHRAAPAEAAIDIPIETMREVTRVLSQDSFEGRAPGTAGEEKTLAYLVERFRAAGLQPGNVTVNGASWLQDVPLVEVTAGGYSPLSVTGGKAPLAFAYGKDFTGVSFRIVPRTDLKDSELVFVGYGINAPEKGWNDYAGLDMRGKTAVILINDPDYAEAGLTGTFNGRAMTYYGRWTYKFEEAARQGASAALIVHDTFPAAYGWNVVESSWTGAQAYARSKDDGAGQTQVNGWLQKATAEAILAAAGQNLETLSAAARQKGFRAVPLGLRASLSFDNAIRRFTSKNVVGVLPGKSRPGEYVLYSAHWDHLGRCKANAAGDDICNGAIDNATGTAALVALAQAHARAGPPARSLVFLAVTAEESGLLGSEYYGANPVFPLARTVGGVNMDAISLAGPARDVTVVGGGKSELDAVLARALLEEGRVQTPDPTPEKGYYYRSDHFSLAKRGVPMLYVDSGEDLIAGGRAAGAALEQDYRDNRYHGPDDEFDPAWDWSGVEADVRLYYRLGRTMAESSAWPNWLPGDEFRRVRDESLAEESIRQMMGRDAIVHAFRCSVSDRSLWPVDQMQSDCLGEHPAIACPNACAWGTRRCGDEMNIDKAEAGSPKARSFEKIVELILLDWLNARQLQQCEGQEFAADGVSGEDFAGHEGMLNDKGIGNQACQNGNWSCQMFDPYRSIDQDHQVGLSRGGTTRSGIVPPIRINCRPASRWMNAVSAARSSASGSLIPEMNMASFLSFSRSSEAVRRPDERPLSKRTRPSRKSISCGFANQPASIQALA